MKKILEQCSFGPLLSVDLGLSFTARKNEEIQYMYCPRSGASFSKTFESKIDALTWADSIHIDDPMEYMDMSFLNNQFGEFFASSGWVARSPVALHLWVQK